MIGLSLVWVGLLVWELTAGLPAWAEMLGTGLWLIFGAEFALKLVLAKDKGAFLAANWLSLVSLALPALRVFRVFRAARFLRFARAGRGLRLARVATSLNRGMGALRGIFGGHGFGYVLLLTLLVTLGGAAGMYAFEQDAPGGPGFASFWDALWWTAMLVTTVGSEYWPRTPEGRLLTLGLALYALSVFGFITARLASWFIAEKPQGRSLDEVHAELVRLREAIEARED